MFLNKDIVFFPQALLDFSIEVLIFLSSWLGLASVNPWLGLASPRQGLAEASPSHGLEESSPSHGLEETNSPAHSLDLLY